MFTRCRPYRKNDQAWVEQKNGAVVRRAVGYRRYEGLEAAAALARLYTALRLFVNFCGSTGARSAQHDARAAPYASRRLAAPTFAARVTLNVSTGLPR